MDQAIYLALHGEYSRTQHKQGSPIALHFEVNDIKETIRRVPKFGGHLLQDIRRLDFREFAERQLVEDKEVADPDGNELEVRQVLEMN
jgi:predicted enzyme related to lactoylglutathione lyase